jgi:hypothetical protein
MYTIIKQHLNLVEFDTPDLHSFGEWISQTDKSYYESEGVAFNNIKNEIADYVELKQENVNE